MVSFLEYLVFFEAVFCLEQLEMICNMDFDKFFGILIFDPKRWFCEGYSLCVMGDFQNGLISRKFSVFWSGFLHRTTRNDLKNGFWQVFRNINFWPKVTILQRLSLCMMGDIQMVSFLEYLVFFEVVFCLEQLEMICRMDFDKFFEILIFDPKWGFCKGYSLCMMGDFQNDLISQIFSVFLSASLPRTIWNDL